MNKKRIVITGIGIITSAGIGKEAFIGGIRNGKSGIRKIKMFDIKVQDIKVGGEIKKFNPRDIIGDKGMVDMDRATALLLCAGKMALDDTGLSSDSDDRSSVGVSIGATYGSLKSILDFDRESIVDGPRFVNASRFPNTVMNSPAGHLAIRFGLKAVNCTISTGFCASADAVKYAINAIESDRANVMLAGGTEEICLETFLGFKKIKYLATANKEGKAIMRPFDKDRTGTILGEGSSILVLEELEHAKKRNAKIYGEISNISSCYYPNDLFQYEPAGFGMIKAMNEVLSELSKEDTIDCIFANGNSTINGDDIEYKAIKSKDILDQLKKGSGSTDGVPVTAIKSYTGETFSAAGAINMAAAAICIENGFIPKIAGFKQTSISNEKDLKFIKRNGYKTKISNVLVNVFSPNGMYSSCIIKKYNGMI
jgi:3-oxoacyl-[acyl-carrier-protein] synthase II